MAKGAFYLLVFASLGYAIWQFRARYLATRAGKATPGQSAPIKNILSNILGQRKVRTSRKTSGAPMHLMIFYGFLALLIATSLLAIASYAPLIGIPNFHKGTYYLGFEFVFDLLGLLFVLGVLWALVRRSAFRPKSATHEPADNVILWLLFVLGLTGYLVEAGRIAVDPKSFDTSSPFGYALSHLMPGLTPTGYIAIWWFHALLFATFIVSLPHWRLKHIVFAVASAAEKPEIPMGTLQPISLEEVEETGQIGVVKATDFSKWHLLSLEACMECGRCTEVCPANGVGKVLNPKLIAQGVRSALGTEEVIADKLGEEALWACTTCNACVEACPVLIRHVDLIVDARRNLVAEGRLAGTGATMLRQTQSTGNAWGAPSSSREDWMKDREIPLARDKKEFDVLLWVGCAGATDPSAIQTTRATAELLKKANVDFACLGNEEACTGDSARRIGDEFLFQEMASQNVATFSKYKFKKIVTPCPHCMNTLRNEYGQFDGDYEVYHHTEMLSDLVAQGRLRDAGEGGEKVTYHDPCYLGRINQQTQAPRDLIRKSDLIEPEHNGQKTLCCGAGGGRMWMEEEPDQRPGNRRAEELLATGAKTVAVGCPFCRIMLDASIKQVTDQEINLIDLAEMLHKANS